MSVRTETGTPVGTNIPHQAVIPLSAEIMERLPTGHVSGKVLKRVSHLFTIFANSLEECNSKTVAFIEAIRRIPPQVVEAIQTESHLEEYEIFLTEELERTREQLTHAREEIQSAG